MRLCTWHYMTWPNHDSFRFILYLEKTQNLHTFPLRHTMQELCGAELWPFQAESPVKLFNRRVHLWHARIHILVSVNVLRCFSWSSFLVLRWPFDWETEPNPFRNPFRNDRWSILPATGASCPTAKARSHGSQSELVMDLTGENIYELRAIEPIEPLQWQIGGYTPTTVPSMNWLERSSQVLLCIRLGAYHYNIPLEVFRWRVKDVTVCRKLAPGWIDIGPTYPLTGVYFNHRQQKINPTCLKWAQNKRVHLGHQVPDEHVSCLQLSSPK